MTTVDMSGTKPAVTSDRGATGWLSRLVERADRSMVELVTDDSGKIMEIRYPNGSAREMRYNDKGQLCYMKAYPSQIFVRSEPERLWTDAAGRQWNIRDIAVQPNGDIVFDTMLFREHRRIDGSVRLEFPNGTVLEGRDFEGRTFLDGIVYKNARREFAYDDSGELNLIREPSGRVWRRQETADENGAYRWRSDDGHSWTGKVSADMYTTEVRAYEYRRGAISSVSGTSIIREQDCQEHGDIICPA